MAYAARNGERDRSGLTAGLCAALVCAALTATPAGQSLEWQTVDARLRLAGPLPFAARTVVVAIDDATTRAWRDAPTVAWGEHHARLIRGARAAGARRIGLDVIPSFPIDAYLGRIGAAARPQEQLQRAVAEAEGSVVLAAAATRNAQALLPDPALAGIAAALSDQAIAYTDFPPLRGDAVRDALFAVDAPEGSRPGFAAALVPDAAPRAGLFTFRQPGRTPIRGFGINYRCPAPYTVSALALERGVLSAADRAALDGAIALIGFTDSGSSDIHPAPLGQTLPGVSIQARAVETLRLGRPVRWSPPWLAPALTLAVGLAIGGLLPRLSTTAALVAAPVSLALALLGTLASVRGFAATDLVLPLAGPVAAFVLVPLAHLSGRAQSEHRRRRELRATLSRFLSPAVCDYLLASEANRRLGGRVGRAACLFLDLRDSTRFAAARRPEAVMAALNELFAVVVPIVHAHGGSVFKYLGDGLMAAFGVPETDGASPGQDESCRRAVASARAILEALDRSNARRLAADPDAFLFRVGIGIHAGEIVYGNIGSPERPEFTLIGDTVNVSARLEALTKDDRFGTPIVVSDVVFQALGDSVDAVGPRQVTVRGHGDEVLWGLKGGNDR